jgi:hypothetical protein
MTSPEDRKKQLRTLMKALADEPIGPRDPRYFDFYRAAGHPRGADPIADLRAIIELGESGTTCQLFSGFRGSGKSTELQRLTEELQSLGFPVLLVRAADMINLHQPLEPADLLVAVSAAVAETVERLSETNPASRSLLVRIGQFFANTEVDLKEVGVGVGVAGGGVSVDVAKLKLELIKNPSFKARVQKALRHRFVQFESEFRQFMAEAKGLVAAAGGGRSPVLIVDDLEKVRGTGPDQDIIQRGMEQIFWQFDRALHVDGWHTIWTAPPYLQLVNGELANHYDGSVVLPMVRIWDNDEGRTPDDHGLRAMRSCLRKRGGIDDLFLREELLDQLIMASSGHLRALLRLLQDAVREAFKQPDPSVPLNEPKIESIADDYERECRGSVFDDDLPWLGSVAKQRSLRLPNEDLVPRVAKLLDMAVVMTYRNGGAWFDVSHPVRKRL